MMPTQQEFTRLMEDATSFCDSYRSTNIDPAHRRADASYHGILENEADYIERKRSSLFIPKTRDHCTRWMTTITNAFFVSDDMVTLTNTLDPDKARFTNEVVNIRLEKHIPTFSFLSKASDAHVKYGNAVGKTGWDYRTESVMERGLDGVTMRYDAPETDRPFLELVPFENVQYDYRCITEDPVQDSPFWRQWIPMLVGDVKLKFKTGEWKKPKKFDWKNISAPASTALVRKKRQGKMQDPSAQEFGRNDGTEPKEELSSYRLVWAVENYFRIGGTDWTFYSLGDEAIVTKEVRVVDKFVHRRRPYAMSSFSPEAFRSYSDGVPEKIRHPQALLNAQVNMRLDNQNICINKGHIVKRESGVQLQSLMSPRPGMVVMTDDMDAVKWMEPMDVTASSYQEQQITERIIEEISGQSQNRMGVDSSDRQSATEAAIKASSAGEHEGFVIKGFVETFVKPLFSMLVSNIVEMESDQEVLNDAALATGLAPDVSLLTNCEIVINAGMGVTNKELRTQKIGAAIDRGIQAMATDPSTFSPAVKELFRDMLPLLGMKNTDRYLPTQKGASTPTVAGGTPAGPNPPIPGNAALPSPPGISPQLSATAAQVPALGGFARGMIQ